MAINKWNRKIWKIYLPIQTSGVRQAINRISGKIALQLRKLGLTHSRGEDLMQLL